MALYSVRRGETPHVQKVQTTFFCTEVQSSDTPKLPMSKQSLGESRGVSRCAARAPI